MISGLILAFAVGLPSVLGTSQSFSLPFRKVQAYGKTILPPTKTHHRGIAQIGEYDQEVRTIRISCNVINLADVEIGVLVCKFYSWSIYGACLTHRHGFDRRISESRSI